MLLSQDGDVVSLPFQQNALNRSLETSSKNIDKEDWLESKDFLNHVDVTFSKSSKQNTSICS